MATNSRKARCIILETYGQVSLYKYQLTKVKSIGAYRLINDNDNINNGVVLQNAIVGGEPIIVIPGNIVLDQILLDTIQDNPNSIIVSDSTKCNHNNVGVITYQDRLLSFDYKKTPRFTGIAHLSKEGVYTYKKIAAKCAATLFYFEILEKMVLADYEIKVINLPVFQINTAKELNAYTNAT